MENSSLFLGVGFLLLVGILTAPPMVVSGSPECGFKTVFNFGDSNSDTGGLSAVFYAVIPQNGETFFGHPSGRYCNGRLVIDFVAEKLGLPYLSPYLDSFGTNFRHGANFATGGSPVRRDQGYSPFYLGIQISQFAQFKARTMLLYNGTASSKNLGDNLQMRSHVPKPEDFSKALYTLDIGQNDLSKGFQNSTEEQVRKSLPDSVGQISGAIRALLIQGARFFWVHNTGPIGYLPRSVLGHQPKDFDEIGCVKSQNEIAKELNNQLKAHISELSIQFPHSAFTYVDIYSAKYQLICSAKQQGFEDPMNFCCGNDRIGCGTEAIADGAVCDDPSRHISWDGIHYSDAANQWIANRILDGSFSHPPLSIEEACHSQGN